MSQYHSKFPIIKRKITSDSVDNRQNMLNNSAIDQEALKKRILGNKERLCQLLKKRFFYISSFEIYGGTSGLYDYGPPGCALKNEIEKFWREFFIIHDEMFEISTACLTPYNVLKASGHVGKFTDLMVKDEVTMECFRADSYISDIISKFLGSKTKEIVNFPANIKKFEQATYEELEQLLVTVGNLSAEELAEIMNKYEIISPSANKLSHPFPFNLMFEVQIGPSGLFNKSKDLCTGFLRPETAQGIFTNFNRLIEYNGGKLPFAAAQIGLGFRNEISPRNGLLRVREFTMAEIEYFVNPKEKSHRNYDKFKDTVLPLLSKFNQTQGIVEQMPVARAIECGIIDNKALGYFMAKTYKFLTSCGINPSGIRFRQHMDNEMAHYACDCWDCEILTSYGWIEVVGHADRMAYDLTSHEKHSKVPLKAHIKLDDPIIVDVIKPTINKAIVGKIFKEKGQEICEKLNQLTEQKYKEIDDKLNECGKYELSIGENVYHITRDMVQFHKVLVKEYEELITPSVIEPSYGIGRLIYCVLEHVLTHRQGDADNDERIYLAIPAKIAPIKCSILPIFNDPRFDQLIEKLATILSKSGVSYKIDTTGASIGRRYARTDEIGIPYAITIDFKTLEDGTVTIRERESMSQVRVDIASTGGIVHDCVSGSISWEDVTRTHPLVTV